jgi:putative two-component system response regulator
MQAHSRIGFEILNGSDSDLLELAASIALTHHERWDGSGYPAGLEGTDIPIEGRIAAIADVYDALTSDRCYRSAYSAHDALDMMREGRGTHFDPDLLDKFMEAIDAQLIAPGAVEDHV